MPRIKLVELREYAFHYKLTLQPRDINYSGHLSNDALVSLVGAARANMFYSIGLSELDLGDGQTGVIMSDMVVNFKAEAFMFDELLIDTHANGFSRIGFRIFHRVKKGQTIVALVETGMTTFSYAYRKVAPIPEIFLKALAERGA